MNFIAFVSLIEVGSKDVSIIFPKMASSYSGGCEGLEIIVNLMISVDEDVLSSQ